MERSPAELAGILEDRLDLAWKPVGVRLYRGEAADPPEGFESLSGVRYCQAVMFARRGRRVRLEAGGISCPAAASAFGFRELPAGLASGQGLVGFGIAREAEVGRKMFEGMARLEQGALAAMDLAPLETFAGLPDVVVVEDRVERLMWFLLAHVNANGGDRVVADTAVLQATCVDVTLVPFTQGRLNFSFGCYGCREATDIEPGEAVVGFPGAMLPALTAEIERLAERAVPRSRAKRPYAALVGPEGEGSPFGGDACT